MRKLLLPFFASISLFAGTVTNDQIIQMVRDKVPNAEIMDLIKKEGLAFAPTGSTQLEIRNAGGTLDLTSFVYLSSRDQGAHPGSRSHPTEPSTNAKPASTRSLYYGLQFGMSLPQSDLKDTVNSKSAFTYGVRLDIPISSGLALRPRIDFASYSGEDAQLESMFPGVTIDSHVKTFWAGMELLAGPGAVESDGIYYGVGLGVQNTNVKIDLSQYSSQAINDSNTKLGASYLLGYQINNHFGFEARHWYSNPQIGTATEKASFNNKAIALDLTLRL